MQLEVALLGWSESHGGVRMLGRSADAEVIRLVREHLIRRLEANEAAGSPPALRLVHEDEAPPDNP